VSARPTLRSAEIVFSTDILKVSTQDGRNFVLLEPFIYTTQAGLIILVPAGSTSDGASTPPEIWPTIPPFGRYWIAAFLHDYLYRYTQYPKAICDNIFKEAMVSLGVDALDAETIYLGVDLLGQSSFNQDRGIIS
jgi:hypothetical protein